MGAKGVDEFVEGALGVGGILAGQLAECGVKLSVEPRRAADSVAVSKKPTHNSHTTTRTHGEDNKSPSCPT